MIQDQSLSYSVHIKQTLQLAWPVIAGQLGHIIIGQVDNLMIGSLGATELAASALANGMFFLIIVFGFGLSMAISPIISQAIGAERAEEVKIDILREGLKIIFILSLLSIIILFGIVELLPMLGQDAGVVPLAQSYLRIIALSTIPMMLFMVYKHFIDGFGVTKPGMLIMGIMVLFNILLNWILIYGNLGMPRLGLEGAGWATCISRVLGLILIMYYGLRHPKFRTYFKIRSFLVLNKKILNQILRVGIPSGLQFFFEVGAFSGAVILAGRIGEEAQSAHQIAISIASFAYMFYMGISAAGSIRVGNAFGRKDAAFIRKAGVATLITSLGFVLIFVLSLLFFRDFLATIYIDNSQVSKLVYELLIIAALFQFFDGLQAVAQGILRGFEDVKVPAIVAFFSYWIIGLPAAWFFSEIMGWGLNGIWFALTLGLFFGALLLTTRFFILSRRLNFD